MKSIEELEQLWNEHHNLMFLLPILEYSYAEVLSELSENSSITTDVLSKVVEFSLGFPSRHWALKAVGWTESGFQMNSVICEKLFSISSDKTDSQQLRHKSFAQARRWQRQNDI